MTAPLLSDALVHDAEERLRHALLHGDTEGMAQLMAPLMVFVDHQGQRLGREDLLAAQRDGRLRIESLQPSDAAVRLSGDVGVVSVREHLAARLDGEPLASDYRFLRVWKWQPDAGQLQLIASQATAVGTQGGPPVTPAG